jgi:hypothetical protein
VNELIDLARTRKDKEFSLKFNFEKAYDSVNWKYLEFMLQKMKFPEKWIQWMRACIFSSTTSVLDY